MVTNNSENTHAEQRRHNTGTENERFGDEIGRKADRKARARRQEDRGVWFWLGMFGLVGWAVSVPTIAGIALGVWIDTSWPGDISWTLTLLFVGVALGCLNAWYWVKRESEYPG